MHDLRGTRVCTMASLAPSRHWRLRDVPLAAVLLVWAAFAASVIFYLSDWSPVRLVAEVKPPLNNISQKDEDDRLYSGSIFVVPDRGDRCSELGFDNRSGNMWDKGFINCYEAMARANAGKKLEGLSSNRLRAIGKAFHFGGEPQDAFGLSARQ
ncbi:MAG: hypothetical protein HY244_10380 [Rhizobiales bacterium]|nr:hypothetical protein [Hyphomicrobiales bacterium]